MSIRSFLLVATTVASLVVPVGAAHAATTIVVDTDGAAGTNSCDASASAPRTVTEALADAPAGATILVCPRVIVEPGQIVIRRDVTIASFDPQDHATIRPLADTGTGGDARGWWLVQAGVEAHLRDLDLDGQGRRIHQAIRFRGHGSVVDVNVEDIAYNASGPDYSGFGVVAYGDGPVTVQRTSFTGLGRVGALFFGTQTSGSIFADNTYVGKGSGDHLDYGVEVGQGAQVTIRDNTITRARGQAQDAASAAVLLSTAFGSGTGATITGNALANNLNGVFIDDGGDRGLGTIAITRNAINGNSALGVALVGPVTVDATCNWWGSSDGPRTLGGGGDAVSSGVVAVPFLTSGDLAGRCASAPSVVPDTASLTVNEGSEATVTGTYEAGTPDDVVLSASTGEVTKTGRNRGTWTWSATPEDGPSGSTLVTVTGDNGEVGSGEIRLTVDNVAPFASFDAPATAFTERPFTLSLRNASDPSPADRAAGLQFSFDCGTGAGFGALGTSPTTECVVDRGGRRTVRALIRDQDGGSREYTSVVDVFSPDGDGSPDRSAGGTVSPGGSVSTGEDPATPSDPLVTRVETPSGGDVTIEEGPPVGPAPADHVLLVWGAQVTAPAETAERPLELTFRLDADLVPPPVPGTGLPTVAPVRGGEVVLPCSGGTGATPDPCVSSAAVSGDDLVLVVRSSSGGAFDFAEPTVACPAVGTPSAGFADVVGDAHRAAIDCAQRWDLVQGLSATSYGPDRTISRAQVATIIARLLALAGAPLPSDPPDAFEDDDASVHELAIDQLAALGVMNGRTATSFAPHQALTRAQLASILARAHTELLGDPLPPGPDAFVDDDGSVHEDNIDAVAAAGLASGLGDGRFAPDVAVRRDQAASFLTRLLSVWYADHRV